YQEVKTPQVLDRKLWEKSGHWDNYRKNMFMATVEDQDEAHRLLALKPMNCPCHVLIFNQGIRSYRELPLRMAEFGACHRYEPSGALHGIMRVRAFTQDDAHIFCEEHQIADEAVRFTALLSRIYKDLGFESFRVKFSDRPEQRAGDDGIWDRAEGALHEACRKAGVDYEMNPGEGAFYGPKLEFVLRDAIGRDWQCGTFQVDFVLPERLDAEYVAEDGSRKRPVMLHRAILGSFERFLGILIEQHAGRFPLWIAPVQVVVATIVDDAAPFAREAAEALRKAGLRVELDLRNEKINRKVPDHIAQRVPVLVVVGRREAEERKLVLRRLPGRDQVELPLAEAVATLAAEATPPDIRG
ncbi:MAG: threonine--tRNA ligase, partial [Roseomonas sp.]|nr:threonine--tRNA ligase [Roseomonas sp.]